MDLHPQAFRDERAGFSMIELLVALTVLLAATLGFSRVLASSLALARADHESALATEAARQVLVEMSDHIFADTFRLYDASSENDPGGAQTAPGSSFDVAGLPAQDEDADGRVGAVILPVWDGELREDVYEPSLGMPQDLNGDDTVDEVNHAADYRLLPVLVRVEWQGRGGPMRVELGTILAER